MRLPIRLCVAAIPDALIPSLDERRIRDNQYDFPPEKPISPEARDLIQDILTVNPSAFHDSSCGLKRRALKPSPRSLHR